jgi:dolichyl-phosphate beta-glucosyltransferase
MFGFHWCVWLFGSRQIRDTQCGFKLLSRSAAAATFPSLHIERWAFDVELLKIAEITGIPLAEVPVKWTEIEGSKLASIQIKFNPDVQSRSSSRTSFSFG